jgi:uncharacterized cupin superfamily protein
MIATTTPRIDGTTVTAIPLEDRGLFGPPLGEPLDGPMPVAGLRLWTSGDGTVRTGLWECGPGRFHTVFGDDEGELIWLADGALTCVEDGGATTRLGVGDAMLFPPGWSGEWRIAGTLRKVLAGWTEGTGGAGRGSGPLLATPGLSPAAAAALPLDENTPFPPERTGGGPLRHRNRTHWRSADGSLEAGVWEVDVGRFHADFGGFGECFRVVSGEVRCLPDDGGESFTLRAGDWMTFPRGWTGEWTMPSPLRKVYLTWEAR